MTKMDKEYIEKEYEQAIKEYNAALTEDDLDTARRTMKRLEAIAMQDYGLPMIQGLGVSQQALFVVCRTNRMLAFLRKNVIRNNRKPSCFLSLWLSPTCRLLFSHVLTSFESEK